MHIYTYIHTCLHIWTLLSAPPYLYIFIYICICIDPFSTSSSLFFNCPLSYGPHCMSCWIDSWHTCMYVYEQVNHVMCWSKRISITANQATAVHSMTAHVWFLFLFFCWCTNVHHRCLLALFVCLLDVYGMNVPFVTVSIVPSITWAVCMCVFEACIFLGRGVVLYVCVCMYIYIYISICIYIFIFNIYICIYILCIGVCLCVSIYV